MRDLKACRICFNTSNLFDLNNGTLRKEYNNVSGLKTTTGSGMPEYLCIECSAHVRKFKKFRDKCLIANYTLLEMMSSGEITLTKLSAINREHIGIQPQLSFLDLHRAKTIDIQHNPSRLNREVKGWFNIPVNHCNIGIADDPNTSKDIKVEIENKEENSVLLDDFGEMNDQFSDDNSIGDKDEELKDEENPGSELEQSYAIMVPLSKTEAFAAFEISNMGKQHKYQCGTCKRPFSNQNSLDVHARIHDKHISGLFGCEICQSYYKTDSLLQTHMTEKHNYKYLCTKCNEVTFNRTSAKQHYQYTHDAREIKKLHKTSKNKQTAEPGSKQLKTRKIKKSIEKKDSKTKNISVEPDFPKITIIDQAKQYEMVLERANSRNYIESKYKCNLCYRGYRLYRTYTTHMKKHDPKLAGPLQCDMCKLQVANSRCMYKHMLETHLFQYTCRMCDYVCFSRTQARTHYMSHKNVVYNCPHPNCDSTFKKPTSMRTHLRIKHPSTVLCRLCGHSFISETGLMCHQNKAHTKEEVEFLESVKQDKHSELYCAECNVEFITADAHATHLGSSSNHCAVNTSIQPAKRTRESSVTKDSNPNQATKRQRSNGNIVNNGIATGTTCEVCGVYLKNDVQANKHYRDEHPGIDFLKRYMCDVCGHTTKQYANLVVHMRTHTNEKPYACPQCDRRFSMTSNRDRHLVVHTGEKRYSCQHCNRRFSQSSAVKLHIQTVHLKIPYAPWDKKNRRRRKEIECQQPVAEPKLQLDAAGDYMSAYITYNE